MRIGIGVASFVTQMALVPAGLRALDRSPTGHSEPQASHVSLRSHCERVRPAQGRSNTSRAKVPRDAFGAVAPENDLFLEVDHLDSGLQAIQERSDGYEDLQRWTSFAGRQALDYLHRHKSTATSRDESGLAPKLRKCRFFNKIGLWHFWGIGGTSGLFSDQKDEFNFTGEQFWGRAARAFRTRKSLGTLVIFGVKVSDFRGAEN
jgi:hypothetical protein